MSDNLETSWEELNLDKWWDAFVAERKKEFDELQQKMEKIEENGIWASTLFGDDPLNFENEENDWRETSPEAGPLRSNQEENWSQWLGHLVRSSDEFCERLFGKKFNICPQEVKREEYLHDEEDHDRRVDIIIEFESSAISIEVKKGDTDYEKTPQTAQLTENSNDDKNWLHYLLLPKAKMRKLENVFEDKIVDSDEEEEKKIVSKTKRKKIGIKLITWETVSQKLRKLLLSGNESKRWQASAFLFISLIEQKICGFYSFDWVNRNKDLSGVSEIDFFESIEPGNQVEYFKKFLEAVNNE